MMMQCILLAGIMLVLPVCIGMLPIRFMEEKHRTLGMAYLSGFLIMLGAFQLIAIPFIVLEKEFKMLVSLYSLLLLLLAAAALLSGGKLLPKCAGYTFAWKQTTKDVRVLWVIIGILVVLQMVFSYHMQYLDGDDAFFGAIALGTQSGDGMYLKNPYYGYSQQLDMRHALSPIPIFIAWLGTVTGIHTTVLSHSFLGPILLLVMYVVYVQFGKVLFPEKKKNAALFVLLLNIWYLFGNVSLYTAETFAYTRTWQGKAIYGNIVIPSILLFLLLAAKGEMQKGEWVLLFLLSAVSALTTSTGIFMFPILMAAAGLITAVCRKKPVLLVRFALCCIPSVMYGLLYLVLK